VVRRKIGKMSKNWELEIIMSQRDDSLLLKYDIKKAFLKEKSSLSIFAKKNSKKMWMTYDDKKGESDS
jgi:hypothetical protein